MERVGDMIVRHRKERLANPRCSAAERAAILARFTPRSLSSETWPLSKAEIAELDAKAGRS